MPGERRVLAGLGIEARHRDEALDQLFRENPNLARVASMGNHEQGMLIERLLSACIALGDRIDVLTKRVETMEGGNTIPIPADRVDRRGDLDFGSRPF